MKFITRSIRGKLIVLFLVVSLIPLTIVSASSNILAEDLRTKLGDQLKSEAVNRGKAIRILAELEVIQIREPSTLLSQKEKIDYILLNRESLGETGEVYLVNEDRIMISESRFIENAVFNQKVDTFPVSECFEKGKDASGIYPDYRGVSIFGFSYCAKDLGFVLMAEIDEDEILVPLNTLQNSVLIVTISTGIAIAVISAWMPKTISNPIKKLKNLAIQISRGDYGAKTDIKAKDEIGELAVTMNQTGKQLAQLQKERDEFASMITHELKTPLTSISGYCEMLKRPKMGKLNAQQRTAVDEIYSSSMVLENLIEKVLTAQKLELKKLKFNIGKILVEQFLANMTTNLLPMMSEKNIKFVNSSDKDLIIRSDKEALREVFTNLVQNAVDFVLGIGGKIEIGARAKDKKVIFYVKDNGKGIPQEKLENLFTKFYQVDTSMTRKHGGSGLGLAICKGIIDGLGGKIWVESKYGTGTTFHFSIPKDMQKASFETNAKEYFARSMIKKEQEKAEIKLIKR